MSVISNTTVLVNFAEPNHLHLLHAVFGSLYIPTEVYSELQDGLSEGYGMLEALIAQVSPSCRTGLAAPNNSNHRG